MAKEEENEDLHVARGKTGRQVRKRRSDGWTKQARQTFLDHFRATCNAAASARAAGLTEGSAHKLRARDPEFAAQWDAVLKDADARLTGKLILFVETSGRPQPDTDEDGDPAVAPIENFDPELALKLLKHHQSSLAGRPRRGGPKPKRASAEELIGSVVKLLRLIKRRRARQAGHGR